MNILYLSTHSILEFDEVKLFTELGHNVFSMGAYQVSLTGDGMRPAIPNLYDNPKLRELSLQGNKENIHPDLIAWADVIVMMHNARLDIGDHPQPWLKHNWKKIKESKKPCVWRSIGQSNAQIEKSLKEFRKDGLKIVRYSPKEETIPDYQGCDKIIRFYKDPDEYKDYNGQARRIVNVSQSLFGSDEVPSRGDHMCKDFFEKAVDGIDWKVFGPYNEKAGINNGGLLSFEDLKQMLRFNRAYFYIGTRPASYTLGFIEAMMTGIPVVTIGPEHGNEIYTDQKTFEAHEIIGKNDGSEGGFWSDSVAELRNYFDMLLRDPNLAQTVGQRGRARAIEFFGKDKIGKEWQSFFQIL